jgi:hypothetical protein
MQDTTFTSPVLDLTRTPLRATPPVTSPAGTRVPVSGFSSFIDAPRSTVDTPDVSGFGSFI